MKKIIFTLILVSFLNSCTKNTDESKNPECVQSYIDYWTQTGSSVPEAIVKKYELNGETLYVMGSNYADDKDKVYNENCELVCEMGGLTGVNTCVNWEDAVFIEVVWEE